MTPLVLLAAAGVALALDAPFALRAMLVLPAVPVAPGLAWRHRAGGAPTALGALVDAAWIGLALTWVDVAAVRELGLEGGARAWGLLALAAGWTAAARPWRRRPRAPRPLPFRELVGALAVVAAVAGVAAWRSADVLRPLDGHWYLSGADDEARRTLPVEPADGWAEARRVGWPEARSWALVPARPDPRLRAVGRARGSLVVAVRGPVGSRIAATGADGRRVEATVEPWMTEDPAEGPVRRYVDAGVAAIEVPVDLEPGEELALDVQGGRVYLVPGALAVWSLHATGELRFVHYYQILNQVENLVWADEVLRSRWFTWNQPPGWSPLLAAALVLVDPDLPGANALFLWVLVLVGLSGVRLASALAPRAPPAAWLLPAGAAAAHGLLMLEPGSASFPDSLYAAALLGVAAALAERRGGAFTAMGIAAQALRWPGTVAASLLALAWRRATGARTGRALAGLWAVSLTAAAAAFALSAAGARTDPDIGDLGFILWFETFPEHWHGDAHPLRLLSRVPGFYLHWLGYTGGVALPLALAGALLGRPGPTRAGLRGLLAGAFLYSLLLCTVDHHPTHYFLPLVGWTGAAAVAGAAALPGRWTGTAFSLAALAGLWIFLWNGVV